MDILEIIRLKRKEMKLTQDQVARMLNVPRTTYQNIENNIVSLKVHEFLKIIKILDIPLASFIDEEYIIISQKDFDKLKTAAKAISTITEKVESNIKVINNSKIVNMNFTNFKNDD